MDKICDRKSFEVVGRCGGDEKTNEHAELTSRTLKNKKQNNNNILLSKTIVWTGTVE